MLPPDQPSRLASSRSNLAGPESGEPLRVWMLHQYASLPDEAAGTRHSSLARHLVEAGHEVTIVRGNRAYNAARDAAPVDCPPVQTIEGVRYVSLPVQAFSGNGAARLLSMLQFGRTLRRLARPAVRRPFGLEARPDVILGSSPSPLAADAARAIARRLSVPLVLEVRDVWPASLIEIGGLSPRHPLIWWLGRIERRLYQQAAAIVSLLPTLSPHVTRVAGRLREVVHVPNGVDPASLRPLTPPPAFAHDRPFEVLYTGTLSPANAIPTMLEAFALLQAANVPARLTLVGSGTLKSQFERTVAEQGLQNVRFEDPIPKPAVPARLEQADCLAVSLLDRELYREHGISLNKTFDYLASGRPTVMAADADTPIAEADAGLVCRPDDPAAMAAAIEQIMQTPHEQRAAMGRRGRALVESKYNTATAAARLEQVLRQAVGTAPLRLAGRPSAMANAAASVRNEAA